MTAPASSRLEIPFPDGEGSRFVFLALSEDAPAIAKRFIQGLSRSNALPRLLRESESPESVFDELLQVRDAIRDATDGKAKGLLEWTAILGRLLNDRNVDTRGWLEIVLSFRRAVYPSLLQRCSNEQVDPPIALMGLDQAIGWLTRHVASSFLIVQHEAVRDALFLRSVVDNIPYMIFVKDAHDLRFVRFNKAGEELLGFKSDDLIGKNDYDLFPEDEADFFTQKDREVLAGGELVDIPEEPIETRHKGLRFLHTTKIPILDDNGHPRFLLGISEDITERKLVQRELREAKEAAEAGSRAKGEFLARMSHEIRTPMTTIIGMTDLALDSNPDAETTEYLTIVQQSAESLLRILGDVLDFSKIESGKFDLETVPFDLQDTVRQTVSAFQGRARDKGLRLELALSPDIPPTLVGDPVRLRQILVNLLDNAIRFTETGAVQAVVRLDNLGDSKVNLRFTVADTGIGVAPVKRTSIFESFTQADGSTTRRFGGTGLGLTICARLVEMMGGRIWIDETTSLGSTFHFTAVFQTATQSADRKAPARESDRPLPGLHVLLAEDNKVNREFVTRLLEGQGLKVIAVSDGIDALETLEQSPADLILIDLEMPRMDGLETTRRIRKIERQEGGRVPIVALTAHATPSDRDRCLAAGMDAYLVKPIRRDELLSAMAAALPLDKRISDKPGTADWTRKEFKGLSKSFLDTSRDELRQIMAALRSNDGPEVRRVAHSIAGAAGMIGADEIFNCAQQMERMAREGNLKGANAWFEPLSQAVDAFSDRV